jgi:hypothetical protein
MMRALRNRVDRRTILRGAAGVGLTLPWLESLNPRAAEAAVSLSPVRLIYWFFPNGYITDRWTPAVPGALDPTKMPICLQPLADAGVTADVNILSGLDNLAGNPEQGGDHACGTCSLLTCAAAKKVPDLSSISLAGSIDQIAARELGKFTPRPSLEMGIQPGGGTGACDTGYACAYSQSLSWSDAKTPRGKRTDPHDAYLYLLGTDNPTLTPDQRDRLRAGDKSVLDFVLDQVNGLNRQIGVSDKVKLDQYATAVRTLEQQLTAITPVAQCRAQPDPGTSTDFIKKLGLMMDVMVFAVQCDLTRVISFMFANAGGPGSMPYIGINSDYHQLTHEQNVPATKDLCEKAITWYVTQAAAFAKRLKGIQEGANNALYNSAFFVSSDVSDGGRHNHDSLPVILGGSAGGAFTTGRHVTYVPEDPKARTLAQQKTAETRAQALAIPNTNRVSNLHLSMLHAVGIDGVTLGDSTGLLPQL